MKTILVALILVVALSACSSGVSGSHFDVKGVVTNPGEQSLRVNVTEITYDEAGWFEVGKSHQIHDNAKDHGTWNGKRTYGYAITVDKAIIEPAHVPVGSCVRVYGRIRDNQEGKYIRERPVFDVAQIIPCSK